MCAASWREAESRVGATSSRVRWMAKRTSDIEAQITSLSRNVGRRGYLSELSFRAVMRSHAFSRASCFPRGSHSHRLAPLCVSLPSLGVTFGGAGRCGCPFTCPPTFHRDASPYTASLVPAHATVRLLLMHVPSRHANAANCRCSNDSSKRAAEILAPFGFARIRTSRRVAVERSTLVAS